MLNRCIYCQEVFDTRFKLIEHARKLHDDRPIKKRLFQSVHVTDSVKSDAQLIKEFTQKKLEAKKRGWQKYLDKETQKLL